MSFSARGAVIWLPLLVVALGLQACGGGGGGGEAPSNPPVTGPPPPPAPSALSYSSPRSYTVGKAITPLDPTVAGTVASYSVAPSLPAGIALDATTGRISGTPTSPEREQSYTVTASNAGGNTTFALTLSVMSERATSDRPYDRFGRQVRVMYVSLSAGPGDKFFVVKT